MINQKKNLNERISFPFLSQDYQIDSCRFKRFSFKNQTSFVSNKTHRHNFTEVHFVFDGYMLYCVEDTVLRVEAGSYLLIPPNTPHRRLETAPEAQTYHLTYRLPGSAWERAAPPARKTGITQPWTADTLEKVAEVLEDKKAEPFPDPGILLLPVLELLSGGLFPQKPPSQPEEADQRLCLAKQYIQDNLLDNPQCEDIAKYCHLSVRQLSRLFQRWEGVSLKGYVDRQRLQYMEREIGQTRRSFREISDEMGFCNEYYFNRFFKNHSGMCPGEYRKSTG